VIVAREEPRVAEHRGTALVRRPGPRLAEGIVTHIARTPVDVELAYAQHAAYRAALAEAGWAVREVAPAPELADAVFVEDTVVVMGDLAVLARPGADGRRPEVDGTREALDGLGLEVVEVAAPGTLDGGDVLQVGDRVYVGGGGRSDAGGIAQLAGFAATRGRTVVPVPLRGVLHLKSAVTALPDGALIGLPDLVDPAALPPLRAAPEEPGAHVVPLGGEACLIAVSAPETARLLAADGWAPVVVDVSEFEKLEGCVTCLNVLIPS
jgi:dimethylargininase